MKMKLLFSIKIMFLGLLAFSLNANAADLSIPTGKPLLEVSGGIQKTNDGNVAVFDREMLASLPQKTVTTETPWTEGEVTFSGPLIRDVLKAVEAGGTSFEAVALNDYKIDIPIVDVETYDVIFAIKKNDKKLSIRDRGPIWVIYPWSDYEVLQEETYYARSIWQLKAIVIK